VLEHAVNYFEITSDKIGAGNCGGGNSAGGAYGGEYPVLVCLTI